MHSLEFCFVCLPLSPSEVPRRMVQCSETNKLISNGSETLSSVWPQIKSEFFSLNIFQCFLVLWNCISLLGRLLRRFLMPSETKHGLKGLWRGVTSFLENWNGKTYSHFSTSGSNFRRWSCERTEFQGSPQQGSLKCMPPTGCWSLDCLLLVHTDRELAPECSSTMSINALFSSAEIF